MAPLAIDDVLVLIDQARSEPAASRSRYTLHGFDLNTGEVVGLHRSRRDAL